MARPQPSINQLRPVLARALELARAAPPNRPMPGPVRGLVRARRLPASWEATMRRALEEDEAYRKWVAEGADEADVGRLAWLWIARPEGWSEELSSLIEGEEADREVHRLADRVAALEAELASARAEMAAMAQSMTGQASELEERDRALARA